MVDNAALQALNEKLAEFIQSQASSAPLSEEQFEAAKLHIINTNVPTSSTTTQRSQKDDKNKFICMDCSRGFRSERHLEIHMNIHRRDEVQMSTALKSKVKIRKQTFAFESGISQFHRPKKSDVESNVRAKLSKFNNVFDQNNKSKTDKSLLAVSNPMFNCPHCNRSFRAELHLRLHAHTHEKHTSKSNAKNITQTGKGAVDERVVKTNPSKIQSDDIHKPKNLKKNEITEDPVYLAALKTALHNIKTKKHEHKENLFKCWATSVEAGAEDKIAMVIARKAMQQAEFELSGNKHGIAQTNNIESTIANNIESTVANNLESTVANNLESTVANGGVTSVNEANRKEQYRRKIFSNEKKEEQRLIQNVTKQSVTKKYDNKLCIDLEKLLKTKLWKGGIVRYPV